jgi:hypothetical protein
MIFRCSLPGSGTGCVLLLYGRSRPAHSGFSRMRLEIKAKVGRFRHSLGQHISNRLNQIASEANSQSVIVESGNLSELGVA